MKALVEKEIRMLLPAFAGAIVLAVLPCWILPADPGNAGGISSWLYLFGTLMLALSTFGREVGLKTFPLMLAQPLMRSRIWWTKIAVLGTCIALTYDAWWLSSNVGSVFQSERLIQPDALGFFGLFAVVFTAGGLWLTLLLRQVTAAFWLAILIPLVLVLALHAMGGADWLIFSSLGLYAVAAFFLARRQFLGLQDTTWTGGIVTLAGGWAESGGETLRERKPWGTLIRKELKLQEFTLAGMAGLFVVHLGVVALRKLGAASFGRATLSILEMFGVLWFFVPLVAGSQSVAEERQLGILDGLLCLPFSRRVQFWVKLLFVMLVGGLLSATLQRAAESVAHAIGAGKGMGFLGSDPGFVPMLLWFLALSLAGLWASTLTRSVVQGMAAGVVISLMFFGLWEMAPILPWWWSRFAFPTTVGVILWMSFGNFRWMFESGRRWRRNILGLTVVLAVTSVLTEAVYHRVWEYAMPVDGEHGPARIPTGKPVAVDGYGGTGLAVVLPDGRLWTDRIAGGHGWISLGGDRFVPGSNWMTGYEDSRDTVAIRSDGTLWVSEKPGAPWLNDRHPAPQKQVPMVQFGVESNWQSVTRNPTLLLKRDGTLWSWGNNDLGNRNYKGLDSFAPQRLGSDSDWDRILSGSRFPYGWKRDGSAWAVEVDVSPTNRANIRLPDLDNYRLRSLSSYPCALDIDVCVRDDGTLWWWETPTLYWRVPNPLAENPRRLQIVQIGGESDWAVVAGGLYRMAAVKTDGSLWSWNLLERNRLATIEVLKKAPRQIGKRDDWISVSLWFDQSAALAADGTFWNLPGTEANTYDAPEPWLAPSRRMSKIENIFGEQN